MTNVDETQLSRIAAAVSRMRRRAVEVDQAAPVDLDQAGAVIVLDQAGAAADYREVPARVAAHGPAYLVAAPAGAILREFEDYAAAEEFGLAYAPATMYRRRYSDARTFQVHGWWDADGRWTGSAAGGDPAAVRARRERAARREDRAAVEAVRAALVEAAATADRGFGDLSGQYIAERLQSAVLLAAADLARVLGSEVDQ